MRVRATCDDCGRQFLFFQLYNAHPDDADRCPHCGRHLGVVNVRPLALRIERAAAQLTDCLHDLAARNPAFRVQPDTILGAITDGVAALSPTTDGPGAAEEDHDHNIRFLRWPWHRRQQPAA